MSKETTTATETTIENVIKIHLAHIHLGRNWLLRFYYEQLKLWFALEVTAHLPKGVSKPAIDVSPAKVLVVLHV